MIEWNIPDVDLDVKDRDKVVGWFPECIPASEVSYERKVQTPHKSGVYFQNIPMDVSNGLASFPYDIAEELGYYKIDFLSNHVYDKIRNEGHLHQLVNAPVNWDWFTDPDFYLDDDPAYRLTQLTKHLKLCKRYPPKSLTDIAILIALIRPRKKYLIGKQWSYIVDNIWVQHEQEKGYFFKKSHAFGYAQLVVVHAQLIAKEIGAI